MKRIEIYSRIFSAAILLVACGLFYCQIISYRRYRTMSEENRLRIVPLAAPRGAISDRKGKFLARDRLSFDAKVVYGAIADRKKLVSDLSAVLGIGQEEVEKRVKKARALPYAERTIASDVGTKEAVQLEEIAVENPGLVVEVSPRREYAIGRSSSAILGYLGLINSEELTKLRQYGYRVDDLVGRDGVEKCYDDYLRGVDGGRQIEVDNRGRQIAVLGYKEVQPGKNIKLTVDLDLQKFCASLLDGKEGAIIAMDPASGAVLAMVSSPSYDPEAFLDRADRAEAASLLVDRKYPLMNRAISGLYPPGSVFKVAVAAYALSRGKASGGTAIVCPGSIRIGKSVFHCWREDGHGRQTLIDAIKNSCNVFFCRLGIVLGPELIAEGARAFGLGEVTGVDLPSESRGLVPDPWWKMRTFGQRWYKGETANYAIGQGCLLVTPIQIARMMCVFANGGYLVRPYIVQAIEDVSVEGYERSKVGISPNALETVREGMKRCVNDEGATGVKAAVSGMTVAGKTGTAQTSRGKNHGWFAGFASFDDPKLVVVVFDEYGGKGGYYAAETAGKIFKEAKRLGIIS